MDLRQLTVYEHFGWVNMRSIFFVCGPKFITSSGCEDTPTNPEVIGTIIRWILGQILNFHDQSFLRDPHPHLGVRYDGLVNL